MSKTSHGQSDIPLCLTEKCSSSSNLRDSLLQSDTILPPIGIKPVENWPSHLPPRGGCAEGADGRVTVAPMIGSAPSTPMATIDEPIIAVSGVKCLLQVALEQTPRPFGLTPHACVEGALGGSWWVGQRGEGNERPTGWLSFRYPAHGGPCGGQCRAKREGGPRRNGPL